jgi:hypothetical protein
MPALRVKRRVSEESLLANFWYGQTATNLSGEPVGDLGVTRDGFDGAGGWVNPQ